MDELELLWESLTVAARKDIDVSDFAWPQERKFPVDSQAHLDALAKLIGRAPEAEQPKIKAHAIRIAKRKGFTLPQSWQDEEKQTTESAIPRPQKKIGTLPICWLEYNARSLNGRIYPKATCDAIFRAAQATLNDPDAMPPTTFVSHEAANGNVNTALIGAPVKVWQEGSKFWANIDIADTSVAHDILGLLEGKYLRSGSMRVAGLETMHDRNHDLPLVIVQEGVTPQFLGIDLTTRPGLAAIARTSQVLYESASQEAYSDAFIFETLTFESNQEEPPAMPIPLYVQIASGLLIEARMSEAKKGHQKIHDHLAGVLDATVAEKHGAESAHLRALVESELTEEGRAIAKMHAKHLAAAHDESAKQLGMACEGAYNDALNVPIQAGIDNDNDGIPDNQDPEDESHKEQHIMTEAEMLAALKAKGFSIAAPQTAEEKLAALEARIAEQDQRLKILTESAATTQRQTLATPSQLEESTLTEEALYEQGEYLEGQLAPKNWKALSNRQVPWPTDIDPKLALAELAPFLAHRMLTEEAHMSGRDISFYMKPTDEL